jgi:hypothetical protein
MKQLLVIISLLFTALSVCAQGSDYILVRKHNNRTLKTYFPGNFISAETYDGFRINGVIKAISNDSLVFQQQETRLVGSEFGSRIDTVRYTLSINYRAIKKFNFYGYQPDAKKKGFSQITIPKLLIIGGAGFLTLELVNTAYRKESLTEGKKLSSLTIAAGVAGMGFLWKFISDKRNRVGGKYKVVYVKGGNNNAPLK